MKKVFTSVVLLVVLHYSSAQCIDRYVPIRAMHMETSDSCIPKSTLPEGRSICSMTSCDELGRSLSHGIVCGNGSTDSYGVIIVSSNGYNIVLKHTDEIPDFDSLYQSYQGKQSSVLLVKAILRKRKSVSPSVPTVCSAIICMKSTVGETFAVVSFESPTASDDARSLILASYPSTTDVYVLDSGMPTDSTSHKFIFF